jgi:hypothetical protein
MNILECAYCGVISKLTDDHIPPKSIYDKSRPYVPPFVKACLSCNNKASDDDEYFRDTILKYGEIEKLPQAKSQIDKMVRALLKPEKLKYVKMLWRAMKLVEVKSKAGIIIGKAPMFSIDNKRFHRVIKRYVRGLCYYELNRRIPVEDVFVLADPNVLNMEKDGFDLAFKNTKGKVIQKGVFWYNYKTYVDSPEFVDWLLVFFDRFPIIALCGKGRLKGLDLESGWLD